ncbi:MAG: zinc ribbon domain-containing protein, partial [Pseudomonadota bacterium]
LRMSRPLPPASCAQCGATVPRRARACPECGADERTGWREVSVYDGLDLPDEAFGDTAGAGSPGAGPTRELKWYWIAAATLLLLLLGLAALGLR